MTVSSSLFSSRSLRIIGVVLLIGIAVAGFDRLNQPASAAPGQSTSDAYVQADFTQVAPRIAGQVKRVLVSENQPVKAGDPLLVIDDRNARIRVDEASAGLARANADLASLKARLSLQDSTIKQARATLDADDAAVTLAQQEKARYRNLASRGSGSVQAAQRASADLERKRALRERDRAAYRGARQQLNVLGADLDKARAARQTARAKLEAARLTLSYAHISAPVDGTVAQKVVRPGAYVNVGDTLLTIVPLKRLYITAHFRETQVAHMQPGQPVTFTVDALPGVTLKGKVDSLGPASAVSFSPIPPHNASGNFTKIVQRLPVRIAVNPGQPNADRLKVGMSVEPEVNTGVN